MDPRSVDQPPENNGNQTIELSIPSHPRFLQVVRAMMGRVAAILDIPDSKSGNLVLAVDEACSNIIKHAYFNDPSGTIDFCVTLDKKRLEIAITDYGKSCDISLMKPRALDDIRPGGLGTYIINQVMDEVEYRCGHNGRNQIRMVTRLLS
ncbi:MAG: ATP-binding protein [Desulfobacterales bacterium]|nr:ATP-binding protein [Desulfobacterales bacterium]